MRQRKVRGAPQARFPMTSHAWKLLLAQVWLPSDLEFVALIHWLRFSDESIENPRELSYSNNTTCTFVQGQKIACPSVQVFGLRIGC